MVHFLRIINRQSAKILIGGIVTALISLSTFAILWSISGNHRAEQFIRQFELQNYRELSRSDTFALSMTLTALAVTADVACVNATKNGVNFFNRVNSSCGPGILRHVIKVTNAPVNDIQIEFTLSDPVELSRMIFSLAALNVLLILAIYWLFHRWKRDREQVREELARRAQSMAHDIRSPLSVLSMVVAQEAGVNIERAKLLTAVLQRLNSIANGFLDFNKQMGRSAVVEILEAPSATAPETCLQTCSLADINSSLAGIVSEIRARCPSSVRITFEGPRDIPLVGVRCDKLELGRIFSNCMNNSVEALREDPKFVNVTLNCDGGEVLIEIRDSGCGIPEDKLNDLGMRVVPSEKPDGNGWAIFHAKSKLASWGGDLVLSSPQMRGTTVSIRLPALTLNS